MKDLMKAVRLNNIGEPLKLDLVEVPKVGAEDVLVDIRASGICHSDINYRYGFVSVAKLPIILGHEISGVITEVGNRVEGIEKGDRVCVHYVVSCGHCLFCRTSRENFCEKYQMIGMTIDGGFAEYIAVPASNVLKLPAAVPFEQGAIMGCAVSTAFHALKRGRASEGDTVVIYGVGGLGAHAVQLATKVFGAGNVIAVDVSDEKLKLAEELGADEVVNAAHEDPAESINAITKGRLADVVLDFVGLRKTIENGINCVGKGGRIVIIGIGRVEEVTVSPYKSIIRKEMELIGVNDHFKSELATLIKLTASGKIDLSTSVTHRIPLEDVNIGMEILEKKIGNPVRVVIVK
jgi:2-desacetyl-2-hydroxyethyl bacteriochlorophyllide A dehydrogenase